MFKLQQTALRTGIEKADNKIFRIAIYKKSLNSSRLLHIPLVIFKYALHMKVYSPNLNIKHHLVFGNGKENAKTFYFFLNVFILTFFLSNPCTAY